MANFFFRGFIPNMDLSTKNKISFTGYDARSLKALYMTTSRWSIARELAVIGKKCDFDVFVSYKNRFVSPENIKPFINYSFNPWTQDIAMLTPKKEFIVPVRSDYTKLLKEHFKAKVHSLYRTPQGGNLYYIKDTDGKNILLAGESAKADMPKPSGIKKIYGAEKIDYIPQMDFHIDLFVRPLDNKRILIADDEYTKSVLKKGLEKIHNLNKNTSCSNICKKIRLFRIEHNLKDALSDFENAISKNHYAKLDETLQILHSKGYKIYRVPGRIYSINGMSHTLSHSLNYMNAIVTKDSENNLIYITNKSLFDKIIGLTPEIIEQSGFSFENEFIKSIRPFIKRENIYFIEGKKCEIADLLENMGGGIHCLTTEIPK